MFARRTARIGGAMLAGPLLASGGAHAQNEAPPAGAPSAYVFAPPPSVQANRLYSVNTATGEVSACQFERPDDSLVGVTRCLPRDASAGPQPTPARFDIFSTHYSGETGVFRVNRDTGEMSVCYVRDMPKGGGTEASLVCTPPAR
ncbi:hypothetical protein MWN34_04525 [Ancylobacter sp. 6x-1]|uniref:Secreted protein n=1 Tax=Ancylobacter crimeensis TaxID=2579147 RepID=A0ABT0D8Q2_9HYPH|nr:hypothetical protein [Ancylobacter crimeensis]MCK0196172.1 hypothetical protein [Ancylobacter crimeensis]